MTIRISKYNFAIPYKRAKTASRHILVSIEHISLPYFYGSYIPYLPLSVPCSPADGHPANIHINIKPFDFGQTFKPCRYTSHVPTFPTCPGRLVNLFWGLILLLPAF